MARFKPTRFMAEDSKYNKKTADYAVSTIILIHTIRLSWVIFRNLPDTSRFICRPVMWKIVVGRLH